MKTEQFNSIFMSFLKSFRLPIVYAKTELPISFWLVDLNNKIVNGNVTITKGYSLISNQQVIIGITTIEEKNDISISEIQFLTCDGYITCSPFQLSQLYTKYAKKYMLPQILPFSHLLIAAYQPMSINCNLRYPSMDSAVLTR